MKKLVSSIFMALSLLILTSCGSSKDEEVVLNFLNNVAEGNGDKAYNLVSISRNEEEHGDVAKVLKDIIIVLAKETKNLGGFKNITINDISDYKEKEGIKLITAHVVEKDGNEADFVFYTGDYKGETLIYNLEVKNIKEVYKQKDTTTSKDESADKSLEKDSKDTSVKVEETSKEKNAKE